MLLHQHPDRDELERYARGEMEVERELWIERHLRSDCPACQRSIDSLLPGAPLVASSPPAAAPSASLTRGQRVPAPARGVGQQPALRDGSWPWPAQAADAAQPAWSAEGADRLLAASRQESPGQPANQAASHRAAGAAKRGAQPAPAGGLYGRPEGNDAWERIFAKLDLRLTAIAAEREAAPGLVVELLAQQPSRRAALVEHDRRFSTLSVCDLLVEQVFDVTATARSGVAAAPQVHDLAELALLAADHLDSAYYGSAMVNDMRSRAWAALASARRAAGDGQAAEEALGQAEALAEDGSADPLEEARLLELRAALFSDQGWFEEAADLMDTVVEIYDDVKDAHRLGRALIKKGLYLGYSNRPQHGVELIPQGLALLDRNQEPDLALHARHHLAWFLNDCGDWRRAQAQLAEFRRLYTLGTPPAGNSVPGATAPSAGSAPCAASAACAPSAASAASAASAPSAASAASAPSAPPISSDTAGNLGNPELLADTAPGLAPSTDPARHADAQTALRLDWLDARIAHRAGHLDEAEWRLRRVRQAFVERSASLDAAMVILDLASLYLDQGRGGKVRRLADDLLPIFLSRDLHREAAAALVVFQQAVAGDRVTPSLLRQVAAYLRRGRRESVLEPAARGRIA